MVASLERKQQFVEQVVALLPNLEKSEELSAWVKKRLEKPAQKLELDKEAAKLLKLKVFENYSVGRYKFGVSLDSSSDKLINRIFQKVYSEHKDDVLRFALDQKILEPVYPKWKTTLIIHLPNALKVFFYQF